MQPAISPLATRLTLPKTSGADKAAVLDGQPGEGPFVVQAGPRKVQVTEPGRLKPSDAAKAETRSRHQRSFSVGESALVRRLSKALPSISIPTSLIPTIPTPSFFTSSFTSPPKNGRAPVSQTPVVALTTEVPATEPFPDIIPSSHRTLRQTSSDDSLLYHTLSRVSSLGDDERFAHVREQVNVRIKAIKDSFDGPSFKLPQMPSKCLARRSLPWTPELTTPGILSPPLKKPVTETRSEGHRSGSVSNNSRTQDPLDAVLESLTGDIVIMGGYRGSILRSAKAPHRRLWVPVKVQLGVRKVNLEVGLDPEDEEDMENHIIADGMLKSIGPVDVSKRLFKKLRESENARTGKLRVHDYGYDWRLSPHRLSRKLVEFLEKLPSNQPGIPKEQRGALVIAHSLGGLITRHAVNQRPDLFSGVLYVGVPQRCINVLGPLRNGDAVLLNEKLLTAQVNFSLRTSFVFLPEDGFCFVDKVTREEYRVDFYDVNDWIKYRWCPCVSGPALPALSRSSTFGSLLSLSDSLPSLPLRSWGNAQSRKSFLFAATTEADHTITKDRTLAPQIGSTSCTTTSFSASDPSPSTYTGSTTPTADAARARNIAYLARTLAETKRFRAELAHRACHQEANAYPPLAVIYAKNVPTTYAAKVAGREGIACADAYDDLLFRSGDGVVLAREAMLPEGYELVRDGRVCTDRGHITMLGDLAAVGRGLAALVRGRAKGIGMGLGVDTAATATTAKRG